MRILLLFFYLLSFQAFSQMELSTLNHDFGNLESYSNRYIDIEITNKGPKQAYILSVRKPMEVVFIQSKSLVQKDSSLTLRFQVNPRQKGKFSYKVEVYTSDKDEPHILKLSGNLLNIDLSNSALTACPDFNSVPSKQQAKPFEYTVITIDEETRVPLVQSQVRLIQDGFQIWKLNTDKNGKITQKSSNGQIYIQAQHTGYLPLEIGTFLSAERNQIVVALKKDPNHTEIVVHEPIAVQLPPTPEQPIKEQNTNHTTKQEIELVIGEPLANEDPTWTINWPKKKEKTRISTEIATDSTHSKVSFDSLPKTYFDPSHFKPINVGFVLDISSSMAQNNRMDLMKFALSELTEMIRIDDKISLVTYATDAKVLLAPTSGMNKIEITDQVKKLKASGMTAGGAGIKLGFEQVEKAYISNGINHVFIFTDGGFNRQSEDIQKIIKKYRKKGIQMSVVGIVNQPRDEESMREVARLANGEYIPIFKLEDASNNIPQLIRKLSFIP